MSEVMNEKKGILLETDTNEFETVEPEIAQLIGLLDTESL